MRDHSIGSDLPRLQMSWGVTNAFSALIYAVNDCHYFAICLYWVCSYFCDKSGYLFLMPCYYWQRWFIKHGAHKNSLILWSLKKHWSHKMISAFLGLCCYLVYKLSSCFACVRTSHFSICPVSPASLAKCLKATQSSLASDKLCTVNLNTVQRFRKHCGVFSSEASAWSLYSYNHSTIRPIHEQPLLPHLE